jgi:hypothetical protein
MIASDHNIGMLVLEGDSKLIIDAIKKHTSEKSNWRRASIIAETEHFQSIFTKVVVM